MTKTLHFTTNKGRVRFAVNRELRQVRGGYQLWQTTDEPAQPFSPVFQTVDTLCEWAADHATTFADLRATKEEWRRILTT